MTRRDLLGLGCAAIALAVAPEAEARGLARVAPRLTCPHAGCRHHRPRDGGTCGLALTLPSLPEIR